MAAVRDQFRFQCVECGKGFPTASRLQQHCGDTKHNCGTSVLLTIGTRALQETEAMGKEVAAMRVELAAFRQEVANRMDALSEICQFLAIREAGMPVADPVGR